MATLACCLEVAAPKVGNVNRSADFPDTCLEDFVASGVIFGQVLDQSLDQSTGAVVLRAVQQTRQWVGSNTNLGIVLLIVPIAKAFQQIRIEGSGELSRAAVGRVLSGLTPQDAQDVFAAIRLANPGGLGTAEHWDVRQTDARETLSLPEAMGSVAEMDLVARQYVNQFHEVLEVGLPAIVAARNFFGSLRLAIAYVHLYLMATYPDSLIRRKSGEAVARQSQVWAARLIQTLPVIARPSVPAAGNSSAEPARQVPVLNGSPGDASLDEFWQGVEELDFWLRCDGNKRNPGTTADLVTAILFAGIARGEIEPPFR